MLWARMLAYISGTVDQELLLRNEYLAAENRILRAQVQGRLLLSDAEKATLTEIAYRLGRKALEGWAAAAKPDTEDWLWSLQSGATSWQAWRPQFFSPYCVMVWPKFDELLLDYKLLMDVGEVEAHPRIVGEEGPAIDFLYGFSTSTQRGLAHLLEQGPLLL
jgi:hypothetical protein